MDQHNQNIDKLLSGYNEHIKIGSRTWTMLAVLSIYTISEATTCQNLNTKVPFLDISLDKDWFTITILGIMAALIIRWIEAQSRAMRTRMEIVAPLLKKIDCSHGQSVSAKDLWDARVFPGTTAVWSAPNLIIRQPKCKGTKALKNTYFLFLKTTSILVHLG